jgi:hypothetical protein
MVGWDAMPNVLHCIWCHFNPGALLRHDTPLAPRCDCNNAASRRVLRMQCASTAHATRRQQPRRTVEVMEWSTTLPHSRHSQSDDAVDVSAMIFAAIGMVLVGLLLTVGVTLAVAWLLRDALAPLLGVV